jgi:hypothetical protein
MRNHLELGSWNVVCDRCGLKRKNYQLRQEWTGLMVCADTCYETRHPQTLINTRSENISVSWSRPEPEDVYIVTLNPLLTELLETILTESELPIYTET